MTDSATWTTLESEDEEDLGDRLLEVLPGDGGSIGNLAAREALGRAAGREISEEDYEEVKERLVALGLVRKGRGRGGAVGLAEGVEGGSRYEAPAAPAAGNGRGRAKKEAPAKDFKAVLWASADKLRAQMDAAEYKHLVLGLIFLKYISDTFAAQQGRVLLMVSDPDSDNYIGDDPADHQASLEDRDYYTQENVFWVPDDARWESLRARAKQPEIGQLIDKALVAIENENPTLRGKLDKRFGAAQREPGRLSNFDRVLALLREAMVNGPAALNQLEKEGVIQRFESCFELAWKTTKDYMEANGFVFAVVMPRQVLKDAFAAKLIADGQVWIAMLDHRNLLSHTYNPTVFEQAVEAIHQQYLPAMERLINFLQQEVTP